VLVQHANDLPSTERLAAAEAVQAIWHTFLSADLFQIIGSVGWIVGVLAAAVAFRLVRAPLMVSIMLGLSAIVILHGPPIGPVGLVCFAAAAAALAASQRSAAVAADAGQGGA
jgi:hypothetical protein